MENNPQATQTPVQETPYQAPQEPTMFCSSCATKINAKAVICPSCGVPTANYNQQQQQVQQPAINIVNTNMNTNANINHAYAGRMKNKWVALVLCFFIGVFGAHKFYEGKAGMGILYIFTFGLFGIGVLVDFIAILLKPNPYFV